MLSFAIILGIIGLAVAMRPAPLAGMGLATLTAAGGASGSAGGLGALFGASAAAGAGAGFMGMGGSDDEPEQPPELYEWNPVKRRVQAMQFPPRPLYGDMGLPNAMLGMFRGGAQ